MVRETFTPMGYTYFQICSLRLQVFVYSTYKTTVAKLTNSTDTSLTCTFFLPYLVQYTLHRKMFQVKSCRT